MQLTPLANSMPSLHPESQSESDSLEASFMSAFSSAVKVNHNEKYDVMNSMNNPLNTASPEKLIEYQNRASEYNIYMSFNSAITRKFVNAVDTLLRA